MKIYTRVQLIPNAREGAWGLSLLKHNHVVVPISLLLNDQSMSNLDIVDSEVLIKDTTYEIVILKIFQLSIRQTNSHRPRL